MQGTNDDVIPWQSVQMIYNDMKALHKTVQLIYPGGDHGLKNVGSKTSTDITIGMRSILCSKEDHNGQVDTIRPADNGIPISLHEEAEHYASKLQGTN